MRQAGIEPCYGLERARSWRAGGPCMIRGHGFADAHGLASDGRVHAQGRRDGCRARHRVRRRQRLPRPARRHDGVGVDPGRGDDRRRVPAVALGGTILEANLSQTVGSASTSLATGTIFTIPALFLWGMVPPYLQVVALAFLGALLGLSAMIPLRRLLIVNAHDELPYPEGTACAEVLRATSGSESGASSSAWIFRGMAVGAAVKLLISLAFLFPGELRAALPVLPKAELALEVAPALLGRRLHPRLPAVRGVRRGSAHLRGGADPADRVAGPGAAGAALSGDAAARGARWTRVLSGRATCATSAPARSPRRGS